MMAEHSIAYCGYYAFNYDYYADCGYDAHYYAYNYGYYCLS